MTTKQSLGKCECSDPGCSNARMHKNLHSIPSKREYSFECGRRASHVLYRIDMEDRTGTAMCEGCAQDAFESGLFDDRPNFYSR